MRKVWVVLLALVLLVAPLAAIQAQGGGDVLFEDDFSDDKSGWEVGEYDGGDVGYGDGYYFVTSTSSGSMMWGVANQSFDDIIISVEATQFSGPANNNNGYGVMCRVQSDGSGYMLYISGDGYASIVLASEGEFTALVDWTASDAVVQGNETNLIEASCLGSALSLSVNGELVAEAEDDTYAEGDIAFSATTFEDTMTEIHFDNLVVSGEGSGSGGVTLPNQPTTVDVGAAFSDDFSDPDSGWEVGDYETGDVGYGDGYYYVTSEGQGNLMWGLAGQNFADVMIDVQATQFSAPNNNNNGYGVMCRIQDDGKTGYLLRISGDGFASIYLAAEEEFVELAAWTATDAINQGNATNHIQALCEGSRLALMVNDELVLDVEDDTLTEGDIALAATSFEDTMTEIHFDDIMVFTPEASGEGSAPAPTPTPGKK